MTKALYTPRSFLLDHTDDAILHSLLVFHFLSAQQVCRLHFAPSSLPWVRSRRLKMLVESKYLQLVVGRNKKPIRPYVYTLHHRGRSYLEEVGVDMPPRFNASERARKALLFLEHTLAVNDVLIAVSLLARNYEGITLASMQHELTLRAHPLRITYQEVPPQNVEKTVTQTMIPDAWLDIFVTGQNQRQLRFSIWVEVDRGTIQAKQFKKKVRAIIEYLKSGEYQKHFVSEVALIAFITTEGDTRVATMRTLVQEEASKTQDAWIDELFLLTSFAATGLDPLTLFFSPIWLHPGDPDPAALLRMPR